jgi:hypothetical protein
MKGERRQSRGGRWFFLNFLIPMRHSLYGNEWRAEDF